MHLLGVQVCAPRAQAGVVAHRSATFRCQLLIVAPHHVVACTRARTLRMLSDGGTGVLYLETRS
jgi:hypothetical protein